MTARAAALGLAAALAGCGVKGPPRPPERPAPATPVRATPAPATASGVPGPAAGAEHETVNSCDACGRERPAGVAEER